MPCIVLSGFEAFQGDTINPSWEVVRELHGQEVANHRIEAIRLPCVFDRRASDLLEAVAATRPALVLALGLAAGRAELSFERVALNLIDAPIADNAGVMPQEQPVVADGPAAFFSTLPLRAMVQAVRAAGIPASISYSAGTYVCNQVFYLLQHRLQDTQISSGFLHVPLLPAQASQNQGKPSMSLALQCQGVLAALAQGLCTEAGRRPARSLEGLTH